MHGDVLCSDCTNVISEYDLKHFVNLKRMPENKVTLIYISEFTKTCHLELICTFYDFILYKHGSIKYKIYNN